MIIQGADKLIKTLTELGAAGYDEAAGALWEEGEEIMRKSRTMVPVKTGALRSSARVAVKQNGKRVFVSGTDVTGRTFTVGRTLPTTAVTEVVLSYGGPAIPYALYQHERTDLNHPGQGEAKYLERPFREAAGGMGSRLARRIKRRVEYVAR
jgi:hypothetical protein